MNKFARSIAVLLTLLLAGCSRIALPGSASPTVGITPSPQPTVQIDQTPTSEETVPLNLQIWVPPAFDPTADTPAAALFQNHLDAFSDRHPGVRVNVRVKAVDGSGGLLNSLATASEAAPLALPDLVVLPLNKLGTAFEQDSVYAMDDLLGNPNDSDWYEFAQDMGVLNGSIYGLPLATDALILVYRPAALTDPPEDWDSALETTGPLVFPAADPRADFTIAMYMSAGGTFQDEEGNLALDDVPLNQVFSFYQRAQFGGLMPFWLTQYSDYEQAYQALRENRATMTAVWLSHHIQEPDEGSATALLPTFDGQPYTLVTGWVIASTNPDVSRHPINIELAEYLTESGFLSAWTAEAGYLPPRPSALANWPEGDYQAIASQAVSSAHIIPNEFVFDTFGTPLMESVVAILKQEYDVNTAVETTIEKVTQTP
ncbi:MAG: extracellular solute-binding protein [Anaerolineales bacterium]|nr:extracellular solute-binding protein [Anaerolineales bacterium]